MKKTWVLLGLLLSANAFAAEDVPIKFSDAVPDAVTKPAATISSGEAVKPIVAVAGISPESKVSPVAVTLNKGVVPSFSLMKTDKTVKNALERWTKQIGWQLEWDVAVDYPVKFEANYGGDFELAIDGLLASLEATDYPVQSCAYSNNILRVVRYGEIMRCEIRK